MPTITGTPGYKARGHHGEHRNGGVIGRLEDIIGGNRPRSIWAKKLEALEFAYNIAFTNSDAAQVAVSEYRDALGHAEGLLNHQRAAPPATGRDADETRHAKAQQAAMIAGAERDVERARTAYNTAVERGRNATKALATARRHLQRAQALYKGTDAFQTFTPKPLPKGVDPDEEIARLTAEIRKVRSAPPPQEEVVEGLLAQLDALTGEAKVRVGFGKRTTVGFPVTRILAIGSGDEIPNSPDPRPWLARFHRDELEADIRAQVAAKYEGIELTLSEKDKTKRIAELEAELHNADQIRCADIWARHDAAPTSELAAFPADSDARAILQIMTDAPRKGFYDDED